MRGNQGNDGGNKEGNNGFSQLQRKHEVRTVTTKPASAGRYFKLAAMKVQKIKGWALSEPGK